MKPLLLAVLLLLSSSVAVGQIKLKRSYDKFRDETTIEIPSQYVDMKSPGRLEASAYLSFKAKGEDLIYGITFYSYTRTWKFLQDDELIAIIDGERLRIGTPAAEDRRLGRSSGVTESLDYALTREQVLKMGEAANVEMQIGRVQFRLKDKFRRALQDLAHTKVP